MGRCEHVYKNSERNEALNRVGRQCKQPAINETPFCKWHGGAAPRTVDKFRRERFEAEYAAQMKFTDLWSEEHPMLDPFSLLLWDIRRSGARIEWFDAKLAELEEEKSIWWGITKEESINATEFAGTNKTYEARENVLVKMQNEERKRLKELRDEWQNNRFEAARVAAMGSFSASARQMLASVCGEFGIDISDPEVQARIQRALSALPDPIPAAPPAIKARQV